MKDRKPLVAILAVVTTLLMVLVVVWTLRQSDEKPTYVAPPGPQASPAAPGADFELPR